MAGTSWRLRPVRSDAGRAGVFSPGQCRVIRRARERQSRLAASEAPIGRLAFPGGRSRTLPRDSRLLEDVNFGDQKELESEPTAERARCDSSSASSISNPLAPSVSPRHFSYGRKSPTSDPRTAAVRTSWCIASLRHGRSGNSTSVSWRAKRELKADWPKRRRKPLPEESRVERRDGSCEQMS